MSFAAVSVIAACLLIMGSFSLIAFNLDRVIEDLKNQNEILVFIDEELSLAQAKSIGTRINNMDNIEENIFMDKDEALEQYKSQFEADLFEGIDENPLRHRYRILLNDVSLMQETMDKLSSIAGVAEVSAEIPISEFILSTRRIVNTVSYMLIIMLLGVSVFIISNTVKLATFDRREEIGIMRIVGATYSFIRWPFVIEGFLLGMAGALIGFFIQWGVYSYLEKFVKGVLEIFTFSPFSDMFLIVFILFIGFGFIVGVLGSVLTIRKFLRV
ncbi:MAG: permease-like cell division protein FtsX [Oscillospiraceae bacterium]|nr:permease-like cell division protein FtsX [Oscillospiraceae bacterium]